MKSSVAKKSSGSSIVEYKNLRLNDDTYEIGDVVMIKEYNDDTSLATLIKIWKDKDKTEPFARIRWFYKPSDVFPVNYEFLSEAEVFDSDHEQDVYVVSLYSKAKVIPFEEYHALDEVDDDVYFTRAKYFYKEKIVRPGFEEWSRVCNCNAIVNPDCLYVSCDKCSAFYHPQCVGFQDIGNDPWYCEKCINS